jgi:nucleoside-triphosphatase THEP1
LSGLAARKQRQGSIWLECPGESRIAAIVYNPGDGPQMDLLMERVARQLKTRGLRLAGVVQVNSDDGNRKRCDMELEDVATGTRVRISENRGSGSRGCRLDSFALEKLAGIVNASLDAQIDVVLINKFGKREADGGGFRQVIGAALSSQARVLVGVSAANLRAWDDFAFGLYHQLPMDDARIVSWCVQYQTVEQVARFAPAHSKSEGSAL